MQKGRVRNMFPGGNTSKGFFSRFEYIMRQEEANRIFILKGGPGVGKSTFMKNISDILTDRGCDAEHMHCSSDSKSLDGIVIPELGAALLDGTAPHVTDPGTPGAVDEIVNLGEYWDEAALKANRTAIIGLKNEISGYFQRAYRYLGAAAHIYEDNAVMYRAAMDKTRPRFIAWEFTNMLFDIHPPAGKMGHQRCMFASAVTPDGFVNYLDDLMTLDNIYVFEGFPGSCTEDVLETIKTAALERGFDVEAFYCAFDPFKLEHLILPELNTAFSTIGRYHATDACAVKKVDFREFLDDNIIGKYRSELEYNDNEFDKLLNKAVEMIHNAKQLHDELEAFYIPHMDFDGIKKKQEEITQKILDYAGGDNAKNP
jgi:hypothetical protein